MKQRGIKHQIAQWALWLAASLALPAGHAADDLRDDIAWKVNDPRLGEALFSFYQGDYFSAITRIEASQKTQALAEQQDEGELLLGMLYLSYGMSNEAQKTFSRLSSKNSSPAGSAATLYLAQILYRRDDLAEAEKLVAKINENLPPGLREKRDLLLADILIAKKQYAEAEKALLRLSDDSDEGYYRRHNLAANMIKAGQTQQGLALLNKISNTSPDRISNNLEMKTLQDKANLALGYSSLQAKKPGEAKAYFNKVRLDGYFSSNALLGMGLAEAALGQRQRAIIPWMELQKRDARIPEVQEALLAVPDALFKLESYKESLQHYESAVSVYKAEIERITSSMEAIRAGKMLDILGKDAASESQWQAGLRMLKDQRESRYLPWLMENPLFQKAITLYRSALAQQDILKARQASLGRDNTAAFGSAIAQQLTEAQTVIQKTGTYLQGLAMSDLEQRKQRLGNYLAQANISVAQLYHNASVRGDE